MDDDNKLLLVNPTTREFKVLPSSPFELDLYESFTTMYGVGYYSVGDDYKVVMLSYFDTNDIEMFVNVYSVRNGTWKRDQSSSYDLVVDHATSGVFVNGCIHWLASKSSDNSSVIAAFDLADEKFREVPQPSLFDGCLDGLGVLGGCLCMFSSDGWECVNNVCMMKEYGVEESLSKFTIINSEESAFRPLCLLGKKQRQVVLVEDEKNLVIYHLEEVILKNIVVDGIPDEFYVVGTFLESLVWPRGCM